MSTMELRQSLLQEIANIIDSDELTRKTLEYVRKLRTKEAKKKEIETKEDLTPYTMEEINSWMEEAGIPGMPHEEVFSNMEKKYPWLCLHPTLTLEQ